MIIIRKLALLPLLLFISIPSVSADDSDEICYRQALGVVAELRHAHYEKLSKRETEIAHRAAMLACQDSPTATPAKTANRSGEEIAPEQESDEQVAQVRNSEQDEQSETEDDKGWLESLLDSGSKKERTPMMKQHRTGGK